MRSVQVQKLHFRCNARLCWDPPRSSDPQRGVVSVNIKAEAIKIIPESVEMAREEDRDVGIFLLMPVPMMCYLDSHPFVVEWIAGR